MVREFTLPDVGEGVHEGELVEWLVEPGDAVSEDQPVAKVETDKALVDVPAPVNGTVRELRWEEGDVVDVGEVLLVFDVEGEADDVSAGGADVETDAAEDGERESGETPDDEATAATGDEAAAATGDETGADASSDGQDSAADSGAATDAGTTSGHVFAAPSVRRVAREVGVDIASVEGSGPGGRVTEQDVRAAAEADPGREETEASGDAGEATAPASEATADAATGSSDGTQASAAAGATDEETGGDGGGATTASTATAAEAADRDRTLAAPATRRLAEEHGVDIDAVPADEERDGEPFVSPEAVVEYAEAQQAAQAADRDALAGGEAGGAAARGAGEDRVEREPYRGVRRRIGDAMTESKYTAPHVTHHDEADVTELVEVRERLKPRAEERGITLTYMPFVLKAVTAALKEHPIVNASLDEDAEEIVYKHYYDLGVATATDAGLLVPVVEDVDEKGLLQIASEMNELVQKARDRSIAPEELQGSTFTVTNVGGIGGEYATPIVNYPEVAILALGEIKRKPRVVVDEETGEESIEPRSVLTLSLSFDHRVVDGAIGARFTNAVIERLEEPELLLLE